MFLRTSLVVALGSLVVVAGACGSSTDNRGFDDPSGTSSGASGGASGASGGSLGDAAAPDSAAADECQKMDIVFVVDDSGSMEEEQTNLAKNFPKFASVLDAFKTKSGASLDYRIAVTTTGRDVAYTIDALGFMVPSNEKGDNGAFKVTSSCGGGSQRWVNRSDSSAESTFECRAQVGTSGPSLEMPLYALKLAFNDRMADGTNAGFLRDDALLAIVIITDEDDCSREDNNFTIMSDSCLTMPNLHPVAEYAAMLDTAAKGAGRWAAAVIAGDKSCKSSFGDAIEAARLKDFVSVAGKNGTFSSICDGDLTNGLQKALDTFDAACRSLPPVK